MEIFFLFVMQRDWCTSCASLSCIFVVVLLAMGRKITYVVCTTVTTQTVRYVTLLYIIWSFYFDCKGKYLIRASPSPTVNHVPANLLQFTSNAEENCVVYTKLTEHHVPQISWTFFLCNTKENIVRSPALALHHIPAHLL